jgi:hypothetical protein
VKTTSAPIAPPAASPTNLEISLPCGILRLSIEHAELPVERLCGFAARRNALRGFLFVSKVLGKHYPVQPSVMQEIHARLAGKLQSLPGPIVLVGLAETATGLAQGVFEHLHAQRSADDLLYWQTTRYRFRREMALEFAEPHSHAPRHWLYEPLCEENRRLLREARLLVLIDDEISTGTTLANLASALRKRNRKLERVVLVCLTDWMAPERREAIARQLELPVELVSLLRGSFAFETRDQAACLANTSTSQSGIRVAQGGGRWVDDFVPATGPRFAIRRPESMHPDDLEQARDALGADESLLVLGTGEFQYLPYRIARELERDRAVWYQATTRSPIELGHDITSALAFADNYGEGMMNYIYNVSDRAYGRVLILYETSCVPPPHDLVSQLPRAKALICRPAS